MTRTLVLGGARSGKSTFAERRAEEFGGRLIYVATAEARDREMSERIEAHRLRRGERWRTVEEPVDLAGCLERYSTPETLVLVDCVTLWLSNVMALNRDVPRDVDRLSTVVRACPGPLLLVSNEVGLGIVPDNALARAFRDAAGLANQRLAEVCDDVQFIAAGLPLKLK